MAKKKNRNAKSTKWVREQYERLDETRRLLDEAHERAGELLDLARDFFTKMDATSVEFFERIVEGEKDKDRSALFGLAKATLSEHVGRLEAEKLAVALGCYVIARGRTAPQRYEI
jgi:DNA-binding Lrp family transcriptional regulator